MDEIWDQLFVRGSEVLFRAGLAMIALLEKDLVRCEEFGILRPDW